MEHNFLKIFDSDPSGAAHEMGRNCRVIQQPSQQLFAISNSASDVPAVSLVSAAGFYPPSGAATTTALGLMSENLCDRYVLSHHRCVYSGRTRTQKVSVYRACEGLRGNGGADGSLYWLFVLPKTQGRQQ